VTRLPYVEPAQFSAEQKELYDSIVSGPRARKRGSLVDAAGHLTGPFNGFVRLPALGKHWSAIGETLRFRTTLPRRLFELAVITLAAEWRCSHEWAAHAGLAREAGVAEPAICAVRDGRAPEFGDQTEKLVFDFVRELAGRRWVTDATWSAALTQLGEEQVVELVNTVAYYTALATMLNGFAVTPPGGMENPWPR
jgi:4-carboxymuconolactone decarboxylase